MNYARVHGEELMRSRNVVGESGKTSICSKVRYSDSLWE